MLIVDDNRDWADALATLLTDEGYGVCVAYDGIEAIEQARRFQPQVVLLDIRMPKLDGYDTARIFNRHPSKTRPLLVALTAWPDESGSVRARMAGFDHYLTKPAEAREIIELLKEL